MGLVELGANFGLSVPSPFAQTGNHCVPVGRILTGGSANTHWCRYEVNRTVSGEGGERYIPIHTARRTMSLIDRALASIVENVGEGKRWSGRTQSRESRSPEQLQRERHLRAEEGGHAADQTRNGFVLARPEGVMYRESMLRRVSDRAAS